MKHNKQFCEGFFFQAEDGIRDADVTGVQTCALPIYLFDLRPDMIAALYKIRWQIELLFKQLKGNFPLKYFLGDNENAIKIQIYCALIVNLLLTVVQKRLKRCWAFSNLVSFCRIHLFNYLHLMRFLENPERDWQRDDKNLGMLTLFRGAYF